MRLSICQTCGAIGTVDWFQPLHRCLRCDGAICGCEECGEQARVMLAGFFSAPCSPPEPSTSCWPAGGCSGR